MIPAPQDLLELGKKTFKGNPESERIQQLLVLHMLSGMTSQLDFSVDILTIVTEYIQRARECSSLDEANETLEELVQRMRIQVAMLSEQRDTMEDETNEILQTLASKES